jgi:enoyl-CoA hydratase
VTEPLTYTLEGTTAIVRMDDGKANALSEPMIDALVAAIDRAEREAAAIVLAGRPDRFSGGFDLRVMMSGPEAATKLLRRGSDLLMKLYGTPLPLVIACTGHAIAGGALVVLTGDHRVGATGSFKIGLNELSIGLPVPVLAMELARDRLVSTALTRATLLGQLFAPEEAVAVGYLDEVAAPDAVIARATQEATRLGALSKMAYRNTKVRLRGKTIAYIAGSVDDDLRKLLAPS